MFRWSAHTRDGCGCTLGKAVAVAEDGHTPPEKRLGGGRNRADPLFVLRGQNVGFLTQFAPVEPERGRKAGRGVRRQEKGAKKVSEIPLTFPQPFHIFV